MTIRVLLADDQRLVRERLGTLLALGGGIELVGAAADGEEAIELAREHHPEVLLMDLRMPRLDGIEATRRLSEELPEVKVIALTTLADDESVLGALRAGARGYLTKDAGADDIRAAIFAVAAGGATLDPSVQGHVVAALAADSQGGGRSAQTEEGVGGVESAGGVGAERSADAAGVRGRGGSSDLSEPGRHTAGC